LSDKGKRAMYDAGLFDPLDDDDQVAFLVLTVSLFLSRRCFSIAYYKTHTSGKPENTSPLNSLPVLGRPGFLGLHAGDAGDDGQREKRGRRRQPPTHNRS
jgi:hypothetical protein